jgi:hypothetical protein
MLWRMRRCGLLGRTLERQPTDDLSEVIGDPDGRGPLENLVPGKTIRDLLGVSASGFIVGQRSSEAVEDLHPVNDVKMISPHDATMNELKPRFPSR